MVKKCNKCGISKSRNSFEYGRGVCRICRKNQKKEWWVKDIENNRKKSRDSKKRSYKNKYKLYSTEYRKRNKDKINAWDRKYRLAWRKKNRKIISEWKLHNKERVKYHARKAHTKIKLDVLNAYSNNDPKCVCCGEKNILFLSIDHINNNGADERRKLGVKGYNLYWYLKHNGFPQNGYQVMCFNCNFGKRYYEDCPHKLNL